MTQSFERLGVRQALAEQLRTLGVVKPTPVQERTIPPLLTGSDAIVQAQTGTGKTLAFALPILERIDPERNVVQALVVTPTRELALQITQEFEKLAPIIGSQVLAAYGGQDVEAQIRKLGGSRHIIVGTPGRLLDHLRRGTIRLKTLSMLVLDEADQMLHMGFLGEVEELIAQTPESRQTMLFSATMPDGVRRLANRYMREQVDIRIRPEQATVSGIRQIAVETTDRARQQTLIAMIERHRPYLAVVFCRTKIRAKKLNEALLEAGIASDELHGDLTQAKREQVMRRFRAAKLQVLVATDVAARGIDVEGVTHVFNYDMPLDAESYIHRIGRTGRAGQTGVAVTFVSPRDRHKLNAIERTVGGRLEVRAGADYIGGEPAGLDEAAPARGGRTARGAEVRREASGPRKPAGRRGAARQAAEPQRGGARSEARRGGRDAGRQAARGEARGGTRGAGTGAGEPRGGRGSAPGGRGNAPGGRGSAPGGRGSAPGGRGSAPGGRGNAPGGRGNAPGGRGNAPGGRGNAPGGRGGGRRGR